MAWLLDGEKISKTSLFILAQLTNVTDGRTDTHTQTLHADIGRAYASHRAANAGLWLRHSRQMPRAYDVEGAYERWLQNMLNRR